MLAAEAERIFAHCRGVVEASRTLRRDSYARHARYSVAASRYARLAQRLGRPIVRLWPPPSLSGGVGLLEGVRVVLVTDDPDTRDVMALELKWFGAHVLVVSTSSLLSLIVRSRPDLVLVDLPFERAGAFRLGRRLRAERDRDGGRPRIIALTKHLHDHPEAHALEAGFDAQIAAPVDPESLERQLVTLVPPRAPVDGPSVT